METLKNVFELSPYILGVVPILIGLVEVVKGLGLSSRFAPLASLVLGIGLMYLVPDMTSKMIIIQGIIAGLVASGLYSGTKKTLE